jgi:hypothetical protein
MLLSQQDSAQHRQLRDDICRALGSWRRFLIAIDGVDGSGKTTLGRYLSWQIGASLIETDLFLTTPEPSYRLDVTSHEDDPRVVTGLTPPPTRPG